MKKLTYGAILLTSACFSTTKKQVELGSLKGNVYWKYNDYVGNKPDAGSTITLYSLFDTSYSETVTCDVSGNYSIDSIPAGDYFLVVASKATNERPTDALEIVYMYSSLLKTIARDSFQGLKKAWDSLNSLNKASEEVISNSSTYEKLLKQREIRDSMNHIANRWFEARSSEALSRIGKIISSTPKVRYEMIIIKPRRVETVVTDFGITYY